MKKSIFQCLHMNASAFKDSPEDNHKNLRWELSYAEEHDYMWHFMHCVTNSCGIEDMEK